MSPWVPRRGNPEDKYFVSEASVERMRKGGGKWAEKCQSCKRRRRLGEGKRGLCQSCTDLFQRDIDEGFYEWRHVEEVGHCRKSGGRPRTKKG